MSAVGIIPARWGSTRFPGKALADLAGRPLVEHVYRNASRARLLERIVVATDDDRIRQAVAAFGGESILTAPDHPSGSDRVAQVAAGLACDVVVNIQGDEPLLGPDAMDASVQALRQDPAADATTLAAPITSTAELENPNVVKVVTDLSGRALYFSRSNIPFQRQAGRPSPARARHHIGLFAYRRAFLLEFASWKPTPLEQTEGLEQMRILEHSRVLKVIEIPVASPGVDTPEDLQHVKQLLRNGSA
ncbi:MAG: 3-deoxy-manno-octulosonate cytidylyltransferase [Acidobacteriota bacterium]